jgi:nicotinate-nucleotide pyrophosphorylase (carboxylating)
MTYEEMKKAVKFLKGKVLVEASGGITLENVKEVAETGVDFISVGALTHSPSAADLSLEMAKD